MTARIREVASGALSVALAFSLAACSSTASKNSTRSAGTSSATTQSTPSEAAAVPLVAVPLDDPCLADAASELIEDVAPNSGLTLSDVADGRDAVTVQGSDLSTALVEAGLAYPIESSADPRRQAELLSASRTAVEKGRGAYDESLRCTAAYAVAVVDEAWAESQTVDRGSSAAAAVLAVASLKEARDGAHDSIRSLRDTGAFTVQTLRAARGGTATIDRALRRYDSMAQRVQRTREIYKKRKSAERAEARRARERAAAARRAASAPRRAPSPPDYSGYTGPRCYAPGGRTWRPC